MKFRQLANCMRNNSVGSLLRAFVATGLLLGLRSGFEQEIFAQAVAADSTVQIVADAQGLPMVSPDQLPMFGTFWLITPGGPNGCTTAPYPFPPALSFATYQVANGQFIADGLAGGPAPSEQILEAQATTIVNLINQIQASQIATPMRRGMSMAAGIPGFGGGGVHPDYLTNSYNLYNFNTNLLWLQITNVANGVAYANLYHATDSVYAVWSTTNLALPFTNWPVETEVFPTVSTTNWLPFSLLTLGRQNLFLRAQDWTGVYAHGLPDWWTWYYFHTLNLSWTNQDANGYTFGYDLTNGYDPNPINFTITVTNTDVNTSSPILPLDVMGGVPAYVAVLVNSTNLASAYWMAYTGASATVPLGADGDYIVAVGLRGYPTNATESWESVELLKNTVAAQLFLTSPASGTVSSLAIQFQGYANIPLGALTYDLSNANGTITGQPAFLTGQAYDATLMAFTTNYFQSGDIYVAGGTNLLTLHATDWAGNQTNVTLALNLPVGHPTLSVIWPPRGAVIGSRSLTVQAQANVPGLTVSATVGSTTVAGLVEANGTAWFQSVPVAPGTNTVTLSAINGNGNLSTTNVTVVVNDLGLSVEFSGYNNDLNWPLLPSLAGTINNSNLEVWVNGVDMGHGVNGIWERDFFVPTIPVNAAGTAVFSVVVSNATAQVAAQNFYQPQPVMAVLSSYSGHQNFIVAYPFPEESPVYSDDLNWFYRTGGSISDLWGDVSSLPPGTNWNGYLPVDGPLYTSPYDSIPWESASLSVFITNDDTLYQSQTQARVIAFPSGMQAAGTTNLYLVLATAREYSETNIQLGSPGYGIPYDSIGEGNNINENLPYSGDLALPPAWLQINGHALIATGVTNILSSTLGGPTISSVWGATIVAAAAGEPLDITPTATHVYNHSDYTFNVQAYPIHVQILDANGNDLTLQTNTVIVGQQMNLTCQITFTNSFYTNTFTATNFQWAVPGFAISNYVVAADSSSAFVVTNFPLNNSNAVFYWVDGATNRAVQCSAVVNGAFVTGQAVFNVYRPAITNFTDEPPSYPTNCLDGGTLYLQLGDGNSHGDMMYQVNVLSKYKGRAGIVQLITRSASNGSFGSGSLGTGGQSWLDTSMPYIFSPINTNGLTPVNFSDNPGIADVASLLSPTTTCTDTFVDYIVFRPDAGNPNANIYIPLGLVSGGSTSWGWSASTYWLAGWSTPVGTVTRPTAPNNNMSFPAWSHMYQNSQ